MKKNSIPYQFLISLGLITIIALTCYFSVKVIGYRVVALILLLTVSTLAMLFTIFPVLVSAVYSALVWNFFFIPPTLTFTIGNAEDTLMFLMYFVIALINAVMTFKIKDYKQKARDKEEREKTIKLYNTILNSLSHELRTPISTIIGSVDAIKESNSKLTNENKSELLREIEIAGFRLNRQVENLLNMSRIESGILKIKPDWCDANELIYGVIKNVNGSASHHKIFFETFEKLPLFNFDRGFVEPVLHNLIHNAVQHTPENSIIKIKTSQTKAGCRFVISDNGNGFPENEIKNVFDKFYRLPQTAGGGTGLGLSIAKGFAEAHKGKIKLENNESGGAKFIVEIPAEKSSIASVNYE